MRDGGLSFCNFVDIWRFGRDTHTLDRKSLMSPTGLRIKFQLTGIPTRSYSIHLNEIPKRDFICGKKEIAPF